MNYEQCFTCKQSNVTVCLDKYGSFECAVCRAYEEIYKVYQDNDVVETALLRKVIKNLTLNSLLNIINSVVSEIKSRESDDKDSGYNSY